jgi:hypothetical protein
MLFYGTLSQKNTTKMSQYDQDPAGSVIIVIQNPVNSNSWIHGSGSAKNIFGFGTLILTIVLSHKVRTKIKVG